jgi:hypothetical protein
LYIFPFNIYGERYKGVPQKVDLRSLEQKTDHPKSHIFANPFKLNNKYMNKDDILRFDVSMNNPMLVHISESFEDFSGQD